MKSIKLTEKHEEKLLEICNVLFPEYEKIVFPTFVGENTGGEVFKDYISFLNTRGKTEWTEIHWYEFCDTTLSVILFPMKSWQWKEYLVKNIHPVDYLYRQFKLLK